MKKIFTLAIGLMLTAATFAADRRPTVTVSSAKRYEIVIDGRQYFSSGSDLNISNLFNGQHEIKVYKVKPGFFMSSKKMVASSCFDLSNRDVQISIDRFGQIQVTQSAYGHDWNDRDNGWRKDNEHGRVDNRGNDHDRKEHNGRF